MCNQIPPKNEDTSTILDSQLYLISRSFLFTVIQTFSLDPPTISTFEGFRGTLEVCAVLSSESPILFPIPPVDVTFTIDPASTATLSGRSITITLVIAVNNNNNNNNWG